MSETQSLTDEFNATADRYMTRRDISVEIMLLKYANLQRYKLNDDAPAKREITETLYRCAKGKLKAVSEPAASNQINLHESLNTTVRRMLDTILAEGQAENIPKTAPQELSSISMQMLRNVENLDTKNFLNWDKRVDAESVSTYRTAATVLASFTLECADMLRQALKETNGNVTTSQPVATSRPIQLKQPTGAPST